MRRRDDGGGGGRFEWPFGIQWACRGATGGGVLRLFVDVPLFILIDRCDAGSK